MVGLDPDPTVSAERPPHSDDPTVLAGAARSWTRADLLRGASATLDGLVDLLGELGPGAHGALAFLGRTKPEQHLVAVRAQPDPRQPGGLAVEVMHRLDEPLPELRSHCPGCANRLTVWSRFCPFCAIDLLGVAVSHSGRSRAELLELVRSACEGRYELIGEFRGGAGQGLVYFGRDPGTGEILAMHLQETVAGDDRRTGQDRRGGGTGLSRDRRTHDLPVPDDRRQRGRPRYSLDLTNVPNPLADGNS